MNAPTAISVDRRAERTHLFLVATLSSGRASTAVRVRNLSPTGALVEGGALPPVRSAIILRRGALEALGTIVWSEAGKAGLAFSGSVDVSAWLPTKEVKRQTQVDEISFGFKEARAVEPASVPAVEGTTMSIIAVVAELAALRADLDRLSDKLADDAVLLASHPDVRLLDAAGQRIGKIIDALRTAQA